MLAIGAAHKNKEVINYLLDHTVEDYTTTIVQTLQKVNCYDSSISEQLISKVPQLSELFKVVIKGSIEEIKNITNNKELFLVRNVEGRTPLHIAISYKKPLLALSI